MPLQEESTKKFREDARCYVSGNNVQVSDGVLKGLPYNRHEIAPVVAEHNVIPSVLSAIVDLMGPDIKRPKKQAVAQLWEKFAGLTKRWLYQETRNFIILANWLLSEWSWMHCAYAWTWPAFIALNQPLFFSRAFILLC